MARYIDADELRRRVKEKTNPYGKPTLDYESGVKVLNMIDNAQTTDVVPKSESEKLVQDSTRLVQENETLKDNNEHLAVMLEEAKAEVERLQAEKDALIKNYAECMKDYASEIFAEIEENLNNLIRYYKEKREYVTEIEYSELEQRYCDIKIRTFEERLLKIAELKKKYTEGEDKPAATEEKYFSPEDVRKMTNQEVREKYTAIRKSMERW